jgi:hypothetical protein
MPHILWRRTMATRMPRTSAFAKARLAKRSQVTTPVVGSVETNEGFFSDMTGKPVVVGNYVLTTQSNRLMLAQVKKISKSRVGVFPAIEHRKSNSPPKERMYSRDHHNVSLVEDAEMFMLKLRGQ